MMDDGPRPPERQFVYPCGCVERDRRGGPLLRDCGDPACYRRRRPSRRLMRRLR